MNTLFKLMIAFVGIFIFCANASQPYQYQENWQSPDYIEQAFLEIALKNEYDNKETILRKWYQPVKVHLTYHVAKQPIYANLVDMHLLHLADITGLAISIEGNPSHANVELIFTNKLQLVKDVKTYLGKHAAPFLSQSVCMAAININQTGEIVGAAIVIPVDQAEIHRKLVTCIVEELTQIMGLPNDSDSVYPSIFNDKTQEDLLTGLDGVLLTLLYDPSLKAGMNTSLVKPIVHQRIMQWSKDGTIARANNTMRQGQLYPLMGYEIQP